MESSKVAQLQGSLLVLLGAVTAAMGMPIGLSEEGDLETSDAIFGAVLIVAGLMFLFFGYRLFKAVVFLAGFFFGYWLCYTIMVAINVDYGENEEWIIFGSSMGAGILMGILTLFLMKVGIFLVGALAGFFFSVWILSMVSPTAAIQSSPWYWIFIGCMIIVMGILALVFQKPVLILGTSVVGSYQFFLGVDTFADTGFKDAMEKILSGDTTVDPEGLSAACIAMLVCCPIAALIGIVVQFRTFRTFNHKDEMEKKNKHYIDIN